MRASQVSLPLDKAHSDTRIIGNRPNTYPWVVTPRICALVAILTAITVLVGWAVHSPILVTFLPNLPAMAQSTAIAFLLTSAAVWLMTPYGRNTRKHRLGRLLAGTVSLIGLGTLIRCGLDMFGQGGFIANPSIPPASTGHLINHMAPNSALNFVLLGTALVLTDVRGRNDRWPSQVLCLIVALYALIALVGHLYSVTFVYGLSHYLGMAVHTAALFLILSLGLLLARPDRGFVAILLADDAAGRAGRRFMPLALIAPVMLGGISLANQHLHSLKALFLAYMLVVASIGLLGWLVWGNILALSTQIRHSHESQIRLAEAQQTAHVGSWELDLITGKRVWSDEMFRICGLDPAQGPPSSAGLRACYHPEDLALYDQAMTEMLATGQPCKLDVRGVRPDGEIRWCHLTARAMLNADDQMVRLVGTAADITERKQAEIEREKALETVRQNEARLRMVLESAPIILYAADAEGTVTLSEGKGLAALDLKPGELVGRSVFAFGIGDTEYEANTRRALAGEAISYDARGNGPCLHTELRPFTAADGTVTGIIGVCFDVTERVASEERFRVLFEHSSDAHLLFDEGGIIDCNAAAVALLRCVDKAQILSLHPAALSPEFQPDGQRSLEKSLEMDMLARENGVHRFEWTHRKMDGEEFPAEVTLTPVVLANRPVMIVVWHDLTEHKRAQAAQRAAEQDYRSLFENAAEGIFRSTPEGTFLQANPALARIFGYGTPKVLIRELTDIKEQLYRDPERRAEFQSMMLEQNSVSDFEIEVYRRDGEIIWISVSARPVHDASGSLCWYEGFVQDISARKALEVQQAQALHEAQERADRDPLTGLWNHRAFHRSLTEETARAQREGTALAVVMLDMDNFKFFNDCYGHATGDEVLRHVADCLRAVCRPYDTLARFGGDEFALLLPNIEDGTALEIEARLRADLGGIAYHIAEQETPITISVGAALFPQGCLDQSAVLRLADERLLRTKTGGAAETEADQVRDHMGRSLAGFSMLDALVTAVDNKDRYTRKHSEDVMEYSLMIARVLNLNEATLQTTGVAALLHDVGKIGVPDAILRKPGKLTDEEFAAVRQHPMMGAVMVGAVPGLEGTLDAVRHHHERWDGGGYPYGLKGDETPLMARLMAVADAFSAMTTDRPYRKGMSVDKALLILEAGAGTQWDPECVTAFLRAHSLRASMEMQTYLMQP